jgi:hypothetical protein
VGGTGGGAITTGNCPAGQVARGGDIHVSSFLDAFTLFCSTPVLLP